MSEDPRLTQAGEAQQPAPEDSEVTAVSTQTNRQTVMEFLGSWKPVIEIAVLVVAIITTWILAKSDATFTSQKELLAKATDSLEQSAQVSRRQAETVAQIIEIERKVLDRQDEVDAELAVEDFDRALDAAEGYCLGCVGSPPNYLVEVSLVKAVRAEKKSQQLLTAAQYNRLALLGSSIWDVSKTQAFASKALNDPDCTPLSRFKSHLILGDVKFRSLRKGAELSKVDAARQEFRDAEEVLERQSPTDASRLEVAQCFAIWAMHETYLGYDIESEEALHKAADYFSKVQNGKSLKTDWERWARQASKGFRPSILSLFSVPARPLEITIVPPAPAADEDLKTSRIIKAQYVEPAPELPAPPKKDSSWRHAKTSAAPVPNKP